MSRNLSYRHRNINGIVLLDKPHGVSSNDLLQKVKQLFRAKKAGHTGVLDQLATGMLPICLGEATKFSQHLLDADKRYSVTAKLGERTDTYDATGQVISTSPIPVVLNQAMLDQTLAQFYGKIYQVPPMFSTIKYKGRPLYEYARKGIEVPRKARPIHIYDLQLLYWDHINIELEIHCSKGTYIRTIVNDLGEFLGCGAHVTRLRRLAVAHYPTARMVTLQMLQETIDMSQEPDAPLAQLDTLLLPIDSALSYLPAIQLPPIIAARVRLGQTVIVDSCWQQGLVRMCIADTLRFFGIGEITEPGRLKPRRLIAIAEECI
ncbi:tRNA pseudouridine(55) synthase TruB [Candidatus Palibaumannia cicadellinicola]|uniref:tRNA pseudouridine synthase B n=1 Tax=Candidatus Palibaumannia cicadellinicola TaxID=186490 RepID=A0A2N4XWG7_9GAMM|nr:tRNA pseudouridine(55) synthase TruB [Candidatus Baumannia cicadellinicola]PLK58401.1 tRNA pseudouridine(55) synthase TruB [Candidatus Baumannia cicadellinicola]